MSDDSSERPLRSCEISRSADIAVTNEKVKESSGPNLRLSKCILGVLRVSVVTKTGKPFHHGDTKNTKNPVRHEISTLPTRAGRKRRSYFTFATINVTSSCCEAWPCHSSTFAIIFSADSRADNCKDSIRIDLSFSSPNSIPAGFSASVTPSV
jgi:hypothetical protein